MPVKVRCPKCEKVLNAPDAARGKAVRCPKCKSKVRVPSGRPKKKKAVAQAASPDSTAFLINLDADALEDRRSRICPKCGTDVAEEDIDCPDCGVNLETGIISEKNLQKRTRKATDATRFYKELRSDSAKFWKSNKSLGFRTTFYLTFLTLLAFVCLTLVSYCVNGPPKAFWMLCTFVAAMVGPGWVLFLHLEIVRATLDKKKKLKRINFDFFLSAALGIRLVLWLILTVGVVQVFTLSFGTFLFRRNLENVGFFVIGMGFLPSLLFFPIASSHMAMPIQLSAWKLHELVGILIRTWKGVVYWCLFLCLTMLPALGCFGALATVYGGDVVEFVSAVGNNSQVRAAEAARGEKDNKQVFDVKTLDDLEDEGEIRELQWGSLMVPGVLWVLGCACFSLASVFNMRSNGLFALYFRHDLELVAQEKSVDYVSYEEDMFEEPRTSNVSLVWGLMVLSLVASVMLSVLAGSTILALLGVIASLFFFVPLAGLWRIFEKAGEPGWGAFSPKHISRTLLKPAGYEEWYWVLALAVPVFGQFIWYKAWVKMAARFQKTPGFGVGLAFAGFIFYPMLGLSNSRCLLPEYVDSNLPRSQPEEKPNYLVPAAYAVGGVAFMVLLVWIVLAFLPPGVIGGSASEVTAPEEYAVFRPIYGDFVCEYPPDWELDFGGGQDGIPSWAQMEKGNVKIRIEDSTAGTPAAGIDRALDTGNERQRGEAPVGEVHQFRTERIADTMREYEEADPVPVEHEFGQLILSEFSSSPLFGEKIVGYHATLLEGYHQYTIVCRCAESQFETLKPAFDRIIDSITPQEAAKDRYGPVVMPSKKKKDE